MAGERPRERPAGRIKFLVCIDDSQECRTALRFACMRAQNTGGKVSLIYVIEPDAFTQPVPGAHVGGVAPAAAL
ncbi:MAG: universal stress protein, partial [Rhodospirillales bacterium]|nr:universal stress protein [Rhodospirillales bacterium]